MAIKTIIDDIKAGKTTAVAEVEKALKRAEKTKEYGVFISLTGDAALERAREIDEAIRSGKKVGRLAGVPYVIKDNYLKAGDVTTAAAKMLKDFRSPVTATVVRKLEDEGAISIGHVNLDAFAHGASTENSYYGPTLNANDKTRVAGGSSGGSAVAVALDIVPFAIGTDTGGSIRQPASYNGVVGVKPTYGMVSRFGVVAMASSTDVMGCLTRDVEDAELVMDVMAGRDELDSTTLDDYFAIKEEAGKKQKIGLVKEFMTDDVDESVKSAVLTYVEKLKKAGHDVEEVSMPTLRYSLAVYYIVMPAEVSSNLARYDGVRYGYRADGVDSLEELYGKSRDEGFMAENKRRIMMGNYVLSSGFFDAYYLKAQKVRTLIIREFDKVFEKFDFLIGPVAPTPAFKLGQNTDDPVKMYLEDVMTVPASVAGLPAISVPAGATEEGLSIGVQLIGKRKSDAELMALAKEIENE